MKKIIKISFISILTIFLILLGFSRYSQKKKVIRESAHLSSVQTSSGAILLGGPTSNKEKIESFKKDLEKDRKYWDCIHAASRYEEQGDYQNAILQREKALGFAEIEGDIWQARAGLGRLYGKLGAYDRSLKEYDWLLAYQSRILKEELAKNNKIGIDYRTKILKELTEERKHIETLKANANPLSSDGINVQ